ncbi:U5 small nuclear ribonucleoprotein TSSC4 [Discoglossus pictus]
MSNSEGGDGPPEPFGAFAYDARPDPGTLSLSDSDPSLSDDAEVASLSPDEEEADEEIGKDEGQKPSVLPFTLKGTNANFFQRSNDIFGGLKELETLTSPTHSRSRARRHKPISPIPEDIVDTPSLTKEAEKDGTVCTQQLDLPSTGKATTAELNVGTTKIPVPASRLPDYVAHPERWTKYSLEDVPESSDRANRSTALSFLAGLEQQKESKAPPADASSLSYNQDPSSCGTGRILFNKPLKECRGSTEKRGSQQGMLLSVEELADEGQEGSETPGEQELTGNVGFHGLKKRNRRNIRTKADTPDEEEPQ